MRNQVISLYDYTGEALRPWAEAGYDCFAYDIQHVAEPMDITGLKKVRKCPSVFYFKSDLYNHETLLEILVRHSGKVAFMSAFPPCTDLSAAGAVWWTKKAKENPNELIEAYFTGFGFTRIHRSIIEEMTYPYFTLNMNKLGEYQDMSFDDVSFCQNCKKETGVNPLIVPRLRVGHYKSFFV